MAVGKKKVILNITGIIIVAFWIVMIGILIKRTSFGDPATGKGYSSDFETIESVQRDWKEIYLKDRKVGYSVNLIKPFGTGYFIQEEIFLKLNLMGLGRSLYTITQTNVDNRFILKDFFMKTTSGAVNFSVAGKVIGNEIEIRTGRGRNEKINRIRLSEPPMVSSGIGHMFKTVKIKLGDSYEIPFFDPSSMVQKEAVFNVVARESLRINKIEYDAFRIETVIWGNVMTFWLDEGGNILKEEGFMGLTMIKSSSANAPLDIDGGGDDFYEIAAVPVDRELPDPVKLRLLKLKVNGAEDVDISKEIWDGGRQKYEGGIMEVRKEEMPVSGSYTIPYDSSDDSMKTFLSPEFNIESDSDEVSAIAEKIAGKEKNPVLVSMRMMNWVYHNLDKKPVVSVPSALEVLRTRVGDCNEHSILLTALLRASGIPSRLSIGLVYTRNKFYYHAWNEAFVGEWITLDPTLNQMPADVSHIRLIYGNLDKQVEIMGLIGKLKFEVMDYEYD